MREQRVFEKLRGKEQAAITPPQEPKLLRTFLPGIEGCKYSAPQFVALFNVGHVQNCNVNN
jgi:hypothetical protein